MNRRDILVPLNLEKHSFEGLEFAARMAAEIPVRVALLYVVELNIFPIERRVYDEVCLGYYERLRAMAQCCFESPPHLRVRLGKAYREIVAEAKETDAELIVLGIPESTRRRWRFGHSTVERVIRDAPCLTVALSNSRKIMPDDYRQPAPPFSYALGG